MASQGSSNVSFPFALLVIRWICCLQNVFIAVITETFAEIRVQFSQMWGNREVINEEEFRQVILKLLSNNEIN